LSGGEARAEAAAPAAAAAAGGGGEGKQWPEFTKDEVRVAARGGG